MGNANSQEQEIATGSESETRKLQCSDIFSKINCNKQANCIFLNNCKTLLQTNYISINSIPFIDIISGIEPILNQPEKYNLFLLINNQFNTVLLKSIVINLTNCNIDNNMFSNKYYLYPECNLFLSNQQDNEFALKQNDVIHSFNPVTSEIVPNVTITEEQLDIIKKNDYKIKLIDIYNNEIIIPILNYPTANETVKIQFNSSIKRLNDLNIAKTQGNINQLST
jgi:hypothetical protein